MAFCWLVKYSNTAVLIVSLFNRALVLIGAGNPIPGEPETTLNVIEPGIS